MPNRKYAEEWLSIAWHDLESARILIECNHYTDTIGVLLQQALEKILKGIFAYNNIKIKRTHDLVDLYSEIAHLPGLSLTKDEVKVLVTASVYYADTKYSSANYSLPPVDNIKDVYEFITKFFSKISEMIDK
jgi:HEPN domain-containing protein